MSDTFEPIFTQFLTTLPFTNNTYSRWICHSNWMSV